MAYPQPDEECYQECKESQPAGPNGQLRCICERFRYASLYVAGCGPGVRGWPPGAMHEEAVRS